MFENLLGAAIDSFEMRDRDGMSDDHRQRFEVQAGRPIDVWELDCIESYLISAPVTSRVVNEISVERGVDQAVTTEDIDALLDEAAGPLEVATQDRLSDRYADVCGGLNNERIEASMSNEAARDDGPILV